MTMRAASPLSQRAPDYSDRISDVIDVLEAIEYRMRRDGLDDPAESLDTVIRDLVWQREELPLSHQRHRAW